MKKFLIQAFLIVPVAITLIICFLHYCLTFNEEIKIEHTFKEAIFISLIQYLKITISLIIIWAIIFVISKTKL